MGFLVVCMRIYMSLYSACVYQTSITSMYGTSYLNVTINTKFHIKYRIYHINYNFCAIP